MSIVAHCCSNESNDEFILNLSPSDYSSLIKELEKYYPNLNDIEITYYDPIYNCNIRIIDDDSLQECIQSSIQDIIVKNVDSSINIESLNCFVKNNSLLSNISGAEMSFISGSDSILNSISSDGVNELDELSKMYESIEVIDKEGNGMVYKAKSNDSYRALKIIPTFSHQDIDSIMKGIIIGKMVEVDHQETYLDDIMNSLLQRLVKVTNVFLLNNGNICVESNWMDTDMLSLVKSGNSFDPYYFMRYMLTTLHILNKYKVVHRNIKPSIIFPECSYASFKLAGFELARQENQLKQDPFKMEGSLNLLAPEIVEQMYKGKERWKSYQSPYSISSDIFSLGVTLYQLLTLDTNSQWSILSIELGEDIEPYLRKKITNPSHANILPLLSKMLHRKKSERVSLYVARYWIKKCISLDPINNQNLQISFEDKDDNDELDSSQYSDSSSNSGDMATIDKFMEDVDMSLLETIDFD